MYKENAEENLDGYSSAITSGKGVWMKHLKNPKAAETTAIHV